MTSLGVNVLVLLLIIIFLWETWNMEYRWKKLVNLILIGLVPVMLGAIWLHSCSSGNSKANKPAQLGHDQNRDETAKPEKYYQVTKVSDGDTFRVLIGGQKEKVRLLGINTPESKDPRRGAECYGKEAAAIAGKLLSGKAVRLEGDPGQPDRDKYGRLLRYAYLRDGTFVNLELVKRGYAHEATYGRPHKYREQFRQAQAEAEKNKRGLWSDNVCAEYFDKKKIGKK